MIFGIGCDICETQFLKTELKKAPEDSILRSVFTTAELVYCRSKRYPARHLAARFAAKEAFFKALGTGAPNPGAFREVEVVLNAKGAPLISLSGDTLKRYLRSGAARILVSLSHTSQTALAVVIIEK